MEGAGKACWQWICSINGLWRNSGVGACFFFGMEALREWTALVLIPAIAHPWLLVMLAILSGFSSLMHRFHLYRRHEIAVAEDIQELSPDLVTPAV